ncbi:MAG TPA: hypothetical protein VGA01_19315 [Candidatus Binatia bacterium]
MNILVCDDLQPRADDAVGRIREAGLPEPKQLVGDNLAKKLKTFVENVRKCMKDPKNWKPTEKSDFDDADIIILDNNLAHLAIEGAIMTAESIAGYIRAFSGAPYIISLNKNPDVDFDLRYLVGDYSTRADLALKTEHLANRALWNGEQADATRGFLPWYWPRLNTVAKRRRDQIEFVRRHLDHPVLGSLGFDDEAINFLSLHAKGALSPTAESDRGQGTGVSVKQVTFRDVFNTRDRSLPAYSERDCLSRAEKEGNAAIREIVARVVAADIDLWFRRDVVGPQEPLVDVPHLLMRLPFLLGNRTQDINEWNKSILANAAPYGLEQKLYSDHLAKAKFQHDIWVPAACFWWPKLKADENLNALFAQARTGNWADVVFCEDRSMFLEREPRNAPMPIEFPVEFEGSWGRRYVSRIADIRYAPRSRLAA